MSQNPLVSIVLPTYNGSRFLEQAIQSILSQSYAAWELIIVDDASTDRTPILIGKYVAADKRIRSIRHEANRKLPAALNTGFSQCQGEYLTWLSDDNLFRPTALSEMVAFLDANHEVDIVYTDYSYIDENGNQTETARVSPPEILIYHNCIGYSFLYRRVVQEALGGYTEDLFLVEDLDFWLRALVSFRFEPLHNDLYLYRQHTASLTSSQGTKAYSLGLTAIKQRLPELGWIDGAARAKAYLQIAVAEQETQQIPELRVSLMNAIRLHPAVLVNSVTIGLIIEAYLGHRFFLSFQRLFHMLMKLWFSG